jgi:ribosomal protein L11 methylase PrmA
MPGVRPVLRRLRVTLESGAEELGELFSDLGAVALAREGGAVTGEFEAGRPGALEDRVEAFLHLVDPEGTARLETAVEGGPWLEGWRALFHGADVGRFRVRPPWAPLPAEGVPVIVDPRGAFGSGLHPSTQLALRLLDAEVGARGGQSMLDVGAGSGVLAVAAARCGLKVCALELEPSARAACSRTAAANGVELEIRDVAPAAVGRRFELVIANLPGPILRKLAGQLRAAIAPGGTLIVSGARVEELPGVLQALGGEAPELCTHDAGWAAAVLRQGWR